MESIQRIVIRAEILGQTVPANRAMEHPAQGHSFHEAAVDAKTNDATRKLVHHNEWVRSIADSHRNKSQLHRLSFGVTENVSQEGPPESESGRY
jgi:hypothetical protein